MAPEQLHGTPTDRRADVFALGCVLYEITTTKKPFDGESESDVMKAVLRCEPLAPTEIIAGYPSDLERIVRRAMARDPDDRFASAEGLRLALERWLSTAPPVTDRDVASLVRSRCGAEIEQRRAVLHHAMTAKPGLPPPAAEPRGAIRVDPTETPRARPGRSFLALGAAVLAVAFGSLVWQRPAEPAFGTPESFPRVASVVTPTPSAVPTETAPTAEPEPAAIVPARVTFRVDPPRARLVVDGTPLAADDEEGTFSVERPTPGGTRLVLVKALGRADRRVVVDGSTPATVAVSLEYAEPSVLTSR
jgi:serine/threonine-protein kinase